jgi:hypothetical protein
MTQTTIATQIPAEGLTHTAGDVVLTVNPHSHVGYLIQGRRNGVIDPALCSQHNNSWAAGQAWTRLIAEHAAPAEPAPVAAIPGNVGRQMRISDPSHIVLAVAATAADGIVHQGGNLGQATRTQLRSLTKKGYLTLIYEARTDARLVPIGGRITTQGRRRLAELTAADLDLAAYTARLQAALTFDQPANTAPVAA